MRPALTEYIVKNAEPKDKSYMLSDGGGLYLQVSPNGGKYWIVRIYVRSKEIRRSLGTYPKMSLKTARVRAFELKQQKGRNYDSDKLTFGDVYEMFHECRFAGLGESYLKVINMRWENHIKPNFGHLKLKEISPAMISAICKAIDKKGYNETARRVMGMISKMKMRKEHFVPLSEQCFSLICELKNYTGHTRWLFPSARSDSRSMSEGAVRVALRSMG